MTDNILLTALKAIASCDSHHIGDVVDIARKAIAQANIIDDWQPIETAPIGNADDGPFFDVMWAGVMHNYKPVPARMIDCYKNASGSIRCEHGYPSVTTLFRVPPTHWRPSPKAIPKAIEP